MNKVKEIFSNKDSSSDHVGSTTTSQGARDRSAIDGYSTTGVSKTGSAGTGTGATHGVTGTSTSGTTGTHGIHSTGTGGSRLDDDADRVASQPSLPGHKHNIENFHDIDTATGDKTHDHKHLSPITKEHHRHHETEEVIREREHDKHIHHVQHHVQPVLDTKHHEREHATKVHPHTEIREQHVNTDEDKRLFQGLNVHKNEEDHAPTERTVVDKGEVVTENLHHHVHHVVQPVVERDTHHHNTIHTTIPIKHVTHEAPIVHQSSTHEPMHMKDFLKQGGDLKSNLTHDQAGVLAQGECAREVTGPGEKLVQELGLGKHTSSSGATGTHAGGATTGATETGTTGTTGATGTTGTGTTGASRV